MDANPETSAPRFPLGLSIAHGQSPLSNRIPGKFASIGVHSRLISQSEEALMDGTDTRRRVEENREIAD